MISIFGAVFSFFLYEFPAISFIKKTPRSISKVIIHRKCKEDVKVNKYV
jgi:hypothetical protein